MITAHLPSGYLVGRAWSQAPYVVAAAVAGGVFPDLDLIWFYFVDDRAIHHHRYWVHAPLFWVFLGLPFLLLVRSLQPNWILPALAFLSATLVHITLDSIAGGIMWIWPFSNDLSRLIEVEARYNNWILNFILHPVFLLEIIIWFAAAYLFFRKPNET